MAEYFKYNDEVWAADDSDAIADFIRNEELYSTDDFDNSLDEEYDSFEVCGYTYSTSEVFQAVDSCTYEEEYSNKVKELADEVYDQIESAELGEVIDFRGYSLVACDEDGNTDSFPTVLIDLACATYTIEGGEDKTLLFKTIQREGEENVKYDVEIPLETFKEIAKKILF